MLLSFSDSLREKLSESKEHKKIMDKGKPEGVPQGYKGRKDPLPPNPLGGMLNKYGGKVRLYFKTDIEQLWLGTNGELSLIIVIYNGYLYCANCKVEFLYVLHV